MNLENVMHTVTIQREDNDDGIADFKPYSTSMPLIPSVGDVVETRYGTYVVVSRRIIVGDPASESCEVQIRCRDA